MMIIIKLFSLIFFGLALIQLIGFKGGLLERLGASFILGTGAISIIYFLYIWATNKAVSSDFWLITNFLSILMIYFKRVHLTHKRKKLLVNHNYDKSDLISLVLWLVILGLFLLSMIYTLYFPVHTVDSIYFFDFRAKVVFLSQKLSEIQRVGNWYSYPMFTSMIGLIWRFLGIVNPSSYYPLMYLSFAFVFYSILRKTVSRNMASFGTMLMYTTPITLWQSQLDGLTNIPYTIFLCSSILYLYKIFVSKKPNFYDVILSSIFLGLSVWTRATEPLWIVVVLASVLVFKARRKLSWTPIFILVFYLIGKVWPIYSGNKIISVVTAGQILANNVVHATSGLLHAIIYTTKSMLKLLPESLNPVIYLFTLLVFLDIIYRKFSKNSLFFLLVIAGIMGIILLGSIFMVLNFNLVIHIFNGSLSRFLGTLSPLMWFYIMVHPAWKPITVLLKTRQK